MAELHLDVQKKLYEQLCEKYPECPAMWKYFLALTEIPRPSHHTGKVSAWAQEVGKKIGGTVYDVTAHFDIEGKETILQQFKDLILSTEL